MLAYCSAMTAQERGTVTGKVFDENNNPLPGVAVMVSGTAVGTSTDDSGSFILQNVATGSELEFCSLGFADTKARALLGRALEIVMHEDVTFLDALVVVGYGVQKKSDLTGAISSINAEETLKKMPVNQVSDLLQGRVAGLSVVTSSGAAGASQTLRVRGVNSIKADGGPLVVIDGFPGGSLNSVNPGDIKSVEILKDASSTAIYGSRGANGVILITTKTPQEDKVSVSYNGYVDFGTPQRLPETMDVGDFAMMANEWYQTYYGKNLYTDRQITNFRNGYDTFDYMGAIFNDLAVSHSHDVSVMGGSKKFRYSLSAQYTGDSGIVGVSHNDAWNYRMKIDSEICRYVSVGANLSGRVNSAKANAFSGYYSILTLAQEFPQTVLPYGADGKLTQGTISNSSLYNPMGFIDEQKRANNNDKTFNNWLQAYVSITPLKGLTLRHEHQISFGNRYYGTTSSTQSYSGMLTGKSAAAWYDANSFGWRMTTTLNYMNEFGGGNHRINATLGIEQSLSDVSTMSLSASGLVSENIGWKNMMLSETSKINTQEVSRTTSLSYFGRVGYALLNRYMLTLTFRRDGSSLLAYDNRWDNFPSASVAWNIKEEKFMRNADFIDQLKIRYGFGVSGNQAVAAYSAFSTYSATLGNDGNAAYTLNVGNPSLRWEKTRQHDAGLDASFFKGRLSMTFDWYEKVTENAINQVVLPDDMGQSSGLRNAAEIQNRGFDFTLGATVLDFNDFYWKTDMTLARNETLITKLGDIASEYMELGTGWGNAFYRYYEGMPIGTIYGLRSLGTWSTEDYYDDSVAKPTNPAVRPGSYRYDDVTQDGIINADDYVIIGNGQPKFNWGFNNTLNWKNFDLSFFFIGYHGFDIYNYPMARLTSQLAPVPLLAERWESGVNENARIASFGPNRDAITSYDDVASSTFIEKGDFVKLKNITLGYTLPRKWTEKIHFSSIRAFLSVKNVCTITSYSGNDPELAISNPLRPGLDSGTYPGKRGYIFGLNITF